MFFKSGSSSNTNTVELAASQRVPTMDNQTRIPQHAYGICGCGAKPNQLHAIGCNQERCPVCIRRVQFCGCSHD